MNWLRRKLRARKIKRILFPKKNISKDEKKAIKRLKEIYFKNNPIDKSWYNNDRRKEGRQM